MDNRETRDRKDRRYDLFPFYFERIFNHVFLSSQVGEYAFISPENFEQLVTYKLDQNSDTFLDLKAKNILTDTEIEPVVNLLSTKLRTKKSFLDNFTVLHMVVPTLRCNSNCSYCHASAKEVESGSIYDMDMKTAEKVVNCIFECPSKYIKIEFQGGDPLLRFDIVKYIIEVTNNLNSKKKKHIEFVLCSNLISLTDSILDFLASNNCLISTSLDGPNDIHDKYRILRNGDLTYKTVIERIALVKKKLGHGKISALMTATKDSLNRFPEIVDEYIRLGFSSIFFRSINPYGFALNEQSSIGYQIEDFIKAYIQGLERIIEYNLNGVFFIEAYALLLLARILTPFSTGFVDLQSPSGAGISGVIYNYNGDVFLSDEGRMLSAMGDNKFFMGNVNRNSYSEIFYGDTIKNAVNWSCVECLPACATCAFQVFCGADPVRNYATQKDPFGHRPTSEFCRKNKEIIKYLLYQLHFGESRIQDVFWSWITNRPLQTIMLNQNEKN